MSTVAIASLPLDPLGDGAFLATAQTEANGRLFEPTRERELFPDLLGLAKRLARGSTVVAIPEFVAPFGIADMVALVVRGRRLLDRVEAGVPPLLNELDAMIVANLTPRRGRRPDRLAERLAVEPSSLDRRLATLVRLGAVERLESGSLVRHPALVPLGRIHALEAKVSDWRRAIEQARTYALWADSATSVLMSLPTAREPAMDAAKRWGTGLALWGDWLRQPSMRAHHAGRRLWASEHAVAALAGT